MTPPVSVLEALERCIASERARGSLGPWVVAFSGGGDSTALALGLAELATRLDLTSPPALAVHLFHVDHALDPGSAARAEAAAALARQIRLPFAAERHPVEPAARKNGGIEAAARRVRYAALEAFRLRIGADRILTAHHRDDQIETVLLRIAGGSGIAGLQGIRRRRGPILRPLLDLERSTLEAFLEERGIAPLADPTNLDLSIQRNRIRHRLRPLLQLREPGLGDALLAVAAAAARARDALDRRVEKLLVKEGIQPGADLEVEALAAIPEQQADQGMACEDRSVSPFDPAKPRISVETLTPLPRALAFRASETGEVSIQGREAESPQLDVEALLALPEPLAFHALDLVERLSGRERPGSTRSRRELLRQLRTLPAGVHQVPASGGEVLSWRACGGLLSLAPPPPARGAFSYILEAPGEVEIPEIGGRIRLSRQPEAIWMRSGERRRAALSFPAEFAAGSPLRVEIRNRRPGDRIRALGAPGIRRLKELLIDHKVPRSERDSLPLLIVDGTVAWVPGVTIDDRFRLRDERYPWVAEWIGNPGEGF